MLIMFDTSRLLIVPALVGSVRVTCAPCWRESMVRIYWGDGLLNEISLINNDVGYLPYQITIPHQSMDIFYDIISIPIVVISKSLKK